VSETTDDVATGTDDVGSRAVGPADRSSIDLASITTDLDGVEAALTRLDDGTYWSDETTGAPIPDEVLAARPVTRRADGS
jgi:RNA polymerase-binding transcription factor DksA